MTAPEIDCACKSKKCTAKVKIGDPTYPYCSICYKNSNCRRYGSIETTSIQSAD